MGHMENTHGGSRIGAGRKFNNVEEKKIKKVITMYLTSQQWANLEKRVIKEKHGKLGTMFNAIGRDLANADVGE